MQAGVHFGLLDRQLVLPAGDVGGTLVEALMRFGEKRKNEALIEDVPATPVTPTVEPRA